MTKLNTIKLVTRIVVGICTSATVGQALRNNVPTETKIQKIEVAVGSAAVGAMAGEAAGQYTDRFIDEIAAAFTSAKKA
ncbi:MAG TPA: hypothetical protein PKD16_02205 [Saprospiraceae bacterium]|jgi:heme O synthase-like polyprenyltransferase|nr:hypothetical protein [Saprospiraceae bacterium]